MVERTVFFLVFLVWSLTVTPLSIYLSRQYRIIDEPGGRKKHSMVTPRGAGVVIWAGYLLYAVLFPDPGNGVRIIATGATAIFLFGYMDDMHPLPALWKLAVHLTVALVIAWGVPAPPAVKAAVVLWVAGTTSAYNLVDGINGLSLTIFSLTALMGLILSGGLWWAVALGLSLGVLPWNYPVAKTFLGDGGSTLLGFLCVSQFTRELPFLLEGKGIVIWLASMLLIGGVPVIDTLFSFARRVIKGSSPFRPDRGHFHHLLSDRGLPLSGVLAILVSIHALSLWMAILLLGRHGT